MEVMISILYPILLVVLIITMIALIIIVLLQSDKSGGLGILGGDSSQTGFGNRKADPIVRITQVLGTVFIIGSFVLALFNSLSTKRELQDENINIEDAIGEMEMEDGAENGANTDTTAPDTNSDSSSSEADNTDTTPDDNDGAVEVPDSNNNDNPDNETGETDTSETNTPDNQ